MHALGLFQCTVQQLQFIKAVLLPGHFALCLSIAVCSSILLLENINHFAAHAVDEVIILSQIHERACEQLRRRVDGHYAESKLRVGGPGLDPVSFKGIVEPLAGKRQGSAAWKTWTLSSSSYLNGISRLGPRDTLGVCCSVPLQALFDHWGKDSSRVRDVLSDLLPFGEKPHHHVPQGEWPTAKNPRRRKAVQCIVLGQFQPFLVTAKFFPDKQP